MRPASAMCPPLITTTGRAPLPMMGASAATAVAVATKAFGSEGVAFFNNMRVPAALIAAAAIKDAFVMQSTPEDLKKSKAWRLMRNAYLILMMLAFTSELSCVFISTHAIAALQMTPMNLYAGTLGELLIRELEYEYVGVRTGFTTGLLAFMTACGLRVRYALRKSRETSWCVMWFVLSATASLLTYNNATTLTYGGFTGLIRRWATLHTELILSRLSRPMAAFVLTSLAGSFAIAVKITLRELTLKADTDGDGKLSATELRDFARAAPGGLLAYIRDLRSIWFAEGDGGRGDAGNTPTPPVME